MSILKIALEDLKSGSFKAAGKLNPLDLEFTVPHVAIPEPLTVNLRVSTTDQLTFYVSGSVDFKVAAECRRCLKKIVHEHTSRVRGVFAFPEALARMNLTEAERDGEGILPLERNQTAIELTDLVRETVVLDYPLYLHCSESCKGLCPSCGANLNTETCRCGPQPADPRWAKLTGLN